MPNRHAEDRDERVSDDVLYNAAVPFHDAAHHREGAIGDSVEHLGIGGRIADVRDEDCDGLPRRQELRPRVRRRRERVVLPEDRLLELAERRARLDPELLVEEGTRVAIRGQRIGLPAAPVQAEHQLSAQSLVERMHRDELLDLRQDVRMSLKRQLGVDQLLARGQLQSLEARSLEERKRLEREIGERRATPERKRLAQHCASSLVRFLGSRLRDQPLEAGTVEPVGSHGNRVAVGRRDDDLVPERPAQRRDAVVE